MSQYTFRSDEDWKSWSLKKKLHIMQHVLLNSRERYKLTNNKHYIGFDIYYQSEYGINEEIFVSTIPDCSSSEVRTRVHINLAEELGSVYITKNKNKNSRQVACNKYFQCSNQAPSVWRCNWGYTPIDRWGPIISPIHFEYNSLEHAVEICKKQCPKEILPPEYIGEVLSLKELSSFHVIHNHFPFLNTILKDILPRSLFQYLWDTYPEHCTYITGKLPKSLGICVE